MTQPIPPIDVDRLKREIAGVLHADMCGWNCPGHGIMQAAQDAKYASAAAAALDALARAGRLRAQHTFVIGDRAATTMPAFFRQPERRVEGVVTALADDGFVTVEVEQPGASPMVITAPAADFVFVERSSRLLPVGAEEIAALWFSRWLGASSVRCRDREHARALLGALAAKPATPAHSPSTEETPRVE